MELEEVIHGVEIFGFTVEGNRVTVDVYGGIEHPVSGCLFYDLPSDRLDAQVSLLDRWLVTKEPLSYVVFENQNGYLMETGEYLQRYPLDYDSDDVD